MYSVVLMMAMTTGGDVADMHRRGGCVGGGGLGSDGKEFTTPQGVRNNAKTIYKISMLAQGYQGRAK